MNTFDNILLGILDCVKDAVIINDFAGFKELWLLYKTAMIDHKDEIINHLIRTKRYNFLEYLLSLNDIKSIHISSAILAHKLFIESSNDSMVYLVKSKKLSPDINIIPSIPFDKNLTESKPQTYMVKDYVAYTKFRNLDTEKDKEEIIDKPKPKPTMSVVIPNPSLAINLKSRARSKIITLGLEGCIPFVFVLLKYNYSLGIVFSLCKHPAFNVNQTYEGKSILMALIYADNKSDMSFKDLIMIDQLITYNHIDLKYIDSERNSIFHYLGNESLITKFLKYYKSDINQLDYAGKSIFSYLIDKIDKTISLVFFSDIMKANDDINVNPLLLYAMQSNVASLVLPKLIEHTSMDFNTIIEYSGVKRPFISYLIKESAEFVDKLAESRKYAIDGLKNNTLNINPNIENSGGMTIFAMAVIKNDVEMVDAILSATESVLKLSNELIVYITDNKYTDMENLLAKLYDINE